MKVQDFEGAIQDYTHLINIDPSDTEAYFSRANAYNEIQDYSGAISDYEQILRFDPLNFHAHFEYATLCSEVLHNYSDGIKVMDRAIGADSKNHEYYRKRAEIKLLLEDRLGAISDYDTVITLSSAPNWARHRAYKERAIVKKILKDDIGATADIELANRLETWVHNYGSWV